MYIFFTCERSKIELTEVAWNPMTGCNKISDGFTNCYM
ncbi:MAG: DUF5131 family protein [Ignavibacteria bacterium]|nr:DUF5131 family protein [Ignavibacteria bacterium]